MKRLLISWLVTLLAVAALVIACVVLLGSVVYSWCREMAHAAGPQLKPTATPQTLRQSRQASSLE